MTRKLITSEIRDEILRRNVEEGLTIKELCKEYGFYYTSFFNNLKRNNILTNIMTNKNKVNHCYFSNINTEEKAYFLGLLFSDGCLRPIINSGRISLKLADPDIYMVEKLNTLLCPENKINYKDSYTDLRGWNVKRSAEFSCSSKQLTKDLYNLGMLYQKYNGRILPKLSDILMPHFIRGIFDGDGCIAIKQNKIFKTLSIGIYFPDLNFLSELQSYLKLQSINSYIQKNKTCYTLSFIKDKNVDKFNFLNYIYKNSSIYLNRKFDKYKTLNFTGRYFY
jgi:hypothetical protein